FREVFSKGLAVDDSDKFLPLAEKVVFFTDNCGEVIFDMLFIEELKKSGSHVTVVVKDRPMLNDVTLKEAYEIGLENVADAVYTGGGGALLGTHPQAFSDDVKAAVSNATLLIAKGLANYESMTEYKWDKPVAYLMMIKCDAVGRDLSEYSGRAVKKGDLVAYLRE
ncbi:MAG TPA: ARMT1-like domain-containing protein, partial [Methanocorpusculum sp.]|nr:ARMT1-like domain-containing protein [Methanocorpusculum sp.]